MNITLDDAAPLSQGSWPDMLAQTAALPDQLEASLKLEPKALKAEAASVLLCGLGGSAMGGDIISDHLDRSSRIPSAVVRDVTLPSWADESSFVLLMSYSGNTKETLLMAEEALERECQCAAVTSGGKLARLCEEHAVPHAIVPGGLQPRAALGHLLGASAKVLQSAGITNMASELAAMAPSLKAQIVSLMPNVPTSENEAKRIAAAIGPRVPAVYSSRPIRAAAKRWQTQINENSKAPCIQGELPESNHNQIIGWLDSPVHSDAVPVFLLGGSDSGELGSIMDTTLQLYRDMGQEVIEARLGGSGPLEDVMRGIVLGDMTSLYLAAVRGADPMPVPAITELKRRSA